MINPRKVMIIRRTYCNTHRQDITHIGSRFFHLYNFNTFFNLPFCFISNHKTIYFLYQGIGSDAPFFSYLVHKNKPLLLLFRPQGTPIIKKNVSKVF